MTKSELESKHLAELHALAAEAEVPRYRMLPRAELIEKLAGGESRGGGQSREGGRQPRSGDRPPRRRERGGRDRRPRERSERPAREDRPPREERAEPKPPAEPAQTPETPEPAVSAQGEPARPKRKRRRRFGRKSKGLRVQDLLTPPPGRQALVYGESRTACTALLREIAADLSGASEGPDPIALLIDPSPEELADWKREAPQAELVAAAQARHAGDALAQAVRRAESGEDITLLVDSLTRLDDEEKAKEIFDSGLTLKAQGSLTVVAALERQA